MFEGRMVEDEISLDELVSKVIKKTAGTESGGLVVFLGYVKGAVGDAKVNQLIYEAYEPYASDKLREIATSYSKVEGVTSVLIYHRAGGLGPGDHTIYVIVSAKNRELAFRVAREALERAKKEVPIFKLERRSDGDYWIIGDGLRVRKG